MDASWITLTELQWAYPSFNLDDKVGLQEEGNDVIQNNPDQGNQHTIKQLSKPE